MAQDREEKSVLRVWVLRIFIVFIFLICTIRLFSMQILSGDIHRSRAHNIARQTIIIPAQRGEIFDRHFNQPLVSNNNSFAVNITPGEIPRSEIPEIKRRVAEILDIPLSQIERRIPPSMFNHFQPIEIAVNVSLETVSTLAERIITLPGVSWRSKPLRNYVDTGSLAHILGYLGNITREELTILFNRGYHPGDLIGKDGIERQYDELLRGREGRETRVVDVRGRPVSGDSIRIPPEPGKNLVLTIDRRIQTLAENALGRRIGAVVVLRPTTGEILAMVSYPWFDPNIFNQTDLGAEYFALVNNPNKPFLNRAIQSAFPPASSFKILMSAAIMSQNAFSPEQTIECLGEMPFGDRVFRCHLRRGHGRLNLQQALAQSCNIFYGIVGTEHLGVDKIVHYARSFGFGEISGIDIPGEISGFVPTPQWKERRFHERWHGGDTLNLSIGQGFMLATPLQMANMVAMIVNDGIIYTPHILKEVRDPRTGEVVMSVTPTVRHKSDIDPSVFAALRRDMRRSISEGTARYPVNIRTVQIAGKTGTGEVGLDDRWHSWLVTYGPYETDNPDERIVVSVIVEAANPWEWWAPFATAIIYQGIFANQTYEEAMRALGIHNRRPIQGRRE